MEARTKNKNRHIIFAKAPVFLDARGALAVTESMAWPFAPKRLYFIYDAQGTRGGHAHRKEKELFICIRGGFRARVHDGTRWRTYRMRHPGEMLYTDALIWHEFDQFTSDAIMLALSSTHYEGRKGYIMDFKEFKKLYA